VVREEFILRVQSIVHFSCNVGYFSFFYQKIRLHKIQWKQPRQSVHWDSIKGIIWHTNLEMKDKKIFSCVSYDLWKICV
jgi:hypothetical protein